LPTVYHPDPTEAGMIARLVEAYRVSVLVGTPTFLNGILRASSRSQLATLRLAVTGAEKCPERVYDTLADLCPQATVLEGYGVTECSPIISLNEPADPRRGTIGRPLQSVEHAVVDVETGVRAAPGRQGMLLVRGPNVFHGYVNYEGDQPFVEFEGARWYRTGDLVSEDESGVLTFRGRLKRFTKLGGEMISLPAIEAVLTVHYPPADDGGPVVAVEATPDDEHPEIVLFTMIDIERETVNGHLREAGLSPLHNVRRVIRVDAIPVLGTGKTDYRSLREGLRERNP
jgi:long-chain-fatty-acid--[acyl-carrier-protein] ligase